MWRSEKRFFPVGFIFLALRYPGDSGRDDRFLESVTVWHTRWKASVGVQARWGCSRSAGAGRARCSCGRAPRRRAAAPRASSWATTTTTGSARTRTWKPPPTTTGQSPALAHRRSEYLTARIRDGSDVIPANPPNVVLPYTNVNKIFFCQQMNKKYLGMDHSYDLEA